MKILLFLVFSALFTVLSVSGAFRIPVFVKHSSLNCYEVGQCVNIYVMPRLFTGSHCVEFFSWLFHSAAGKLFHFSPVTYTNRQNANLWHRELSLQRKSTACGPLLNVFNTKRALYNIKYS